MEEWAQRWLELSIMPVFPAQNGQESPVSSIAADIATDQTRTGRHVSVRDYLSSPKVVVFNQVSQCAAGYGVNGSMVWITLVCTSQECMRECVMPLSLFGEMSMSFKIIKCHSAS